jgi:hypothetical protein
MIDDPSFMPVLVAGDRDLGDRHLSRPLLGGREGPPTLAVGFAAGSGEARRWLTVDDAVRRRLSVEGAEHIARQHLLSRDSRPGWLTLRSVAGTWLERRGDEHVATDLIDGDLLRDAAKLLSAGDIAVAVPQSSAMIAAPVAQAALVAALAAEAQRSGRSPLSAAVWLVRDGDVIGQWAPQQTAARQASATEDAPADDLPSPEPREGSAVFSLSCMTVEEVDEVARRCLDRHIPRLVRQDWFKGVVILSVNGYMMPATDANKVALQELAEKLDETTSWKQLTTRNGKPVAIRIRLDA